MSTIQTGIQLGRRHVDLASLNLNHVDADKARIGIRKDGTLVVYTGRSYLLHPDQTRRASQFLRQQGLLQPQQKPRDFRLADLAAKLAPRAEQPAKASQDKSVEVRAPRAETAKPQTALAQRRGAEHLKLAPARVEARPEGLEARKAALIDSLGASDHQCGLFLELQDQIGTRAKGAAFLSDVANARFRNIPTAAATQVCAPDGTSLPANRVQVGGVNAAIASQYPKEAQLESYFSMLAANRTPVLVVLASDKDMAKLDRNGNPDLPHYFSQNGSYGQVEVTSKETSRTALDGGLEVRAYQINVRCPGDKPISIPVLHVPNWADFGAQGADALQALAQHVDGVMADKVDLYRSKNSSALNDPDKLLPVIHCRAGVGRTGQLIAARELLKPGAASLESIVADMRGSRNHLMVQTRDQLSTLADLAERQGRPILQSESAADAGGEAIYANLAPQEPIYANDAPPLPPRRR
ncbi:hypothetical protein DK842_12400 [Chromobacterium phragmitis]|uniref:protein-tyrosine phosphatase family protein n=1 Tax=Chromobacterium phragmitis TaxID=2202141 RepID=UPI000DEC5B58|nr:protein-tyrosine phosphatase family protein [Chromobacterium phragmitis]AXE30633.1 hypothetical protein DK842_12400 [Chromobacterium phragmitis]